MFCSRIKALLFIYQTLLRPEYSSHRWNTQVYCNISKQEYILISNTTQSREIICLSEWLAIKYTWNTWKNTLYLKNSRCRNNL